MARILFLTHQSPLNIEGANSVPQRMVVAALNMEGWPKPQSKAEATTHF
ncbi:MAG: hypothetical protein NVS3B3_13440 [Aquirhabdus sp.]